jgi:hypothetical protein
MIIYLHDKRWQVAQWLPKIQHLLGGFPLLIGGIQKLGDESDRPIAVVEIAVALVVLVAFVKELHAELRSHGHSHSSFGWFDLAAGGLLIFEAFHSPHHKPAYMRPQFLTGIITIGIGLLHGRLRSMNQRGRYLKFDDTGMQFRITRFRRLHIPWAKLTSIDVTGDFAVFVMAEGRRHKVRLNLLHNADEVREGISTQAQTAGVECRS